MTKGITADLPLSPDFLVAAAIYDAFPEDNFVFRPEAIAGLDETFTVIHVGKVVDGTQYFVGLYGEHNLDDMPVNPMGMQPPVLGVRLVNDQLTVADALLVEVSKIAIALANMLMVAQYGEQLTTRLQPDHAVGAEWKVSLEEYPEPATCDYVATITHNARIYCCYVGAGRKKDGNIEFFLLILEAIGDKFYAVSIDDDELWDALRVAFLEHFGISVNESDDEEDVC